MNDYNEKKTTTVREKKGVAPSICVVCTAVVRVYARNAAQAKDAVAF